MHVCKSRMTWRAYPHELMNPKYPDWGFFPESPFGFPVTTLADWRRVFTERPGYLVDEYGYKIDDPIAWLDDVKAPTPEQQKQRRQWVEKDICRGDGWLDGDHWFYAREFS